MGYFLQRRWRSGKRMAEIRKREDVKAQRRAASGGRMGAANAI
jgi:hypothetical protein